MWLSGERLRYDRLFALVTERREDRILRQLEDLGPPPHDSAEEVARSGELLVRLVGFEWILHNLTEVELADAMMQNHEYSDQELQAAFDGISVSLEHLSSVLNGYVLGDAVTRLHVPVYFAEGRHDMTTPVELSGEYFEKLDAPAGKHWFDFEQSGHMPMSEEPDRFRELLELICSCGEAGLAYRAESRYDSEIPIVNGVVDASGPNVRFVGPAFHRLRFVRSGG